MIAHTDMRLSDGVARCRRRWPFLSPAVLFLVMVAITLTTVGLAVTYLPMHPSGTWRGPAGVPWLEGLCRWSSPSIP